jgi:hypothetical protein
MEIPQDRRVKVENDPTPLDFDTRKLHKYETDFKIPDDITPFPLRTVSQTVALVHMTHKNQRPKSLNPGIRIIGAFSTPEEAVTFTETHFPNSKEAPMWITMHQLVPICKSLESQMDRDYIVSTIENIIAVHDKVITDNKKRYEEDLASKRSGESGHSVSKIRQKYQSTRKDNGRTKAIRAQFEQNAETAGTVGNALSGNQAVQGQSFAVIVTLQDIRTKSLKGNADLEPLVAVLFLAKSLEDAKIYAKYTASKVYKNCCIDIIDACQWVFPEAVDIHPQTQYGHEELSLIMKSKETNKAMVDACAAWHEEKDRTPREEIDENKDLVALEPGPVTLYQ